MFKWLKEFWGNGPFYVPPIFESDGRAIRASNKHLGDLIAAGQLIVEHAKFKAMEDDGHIGLTDKPPSAFAYTTIGEDGDLIHHYPPSMYVAKTQADDQRAALDEIIEQRGRHRRAHIRVRGVDYAPVVDTWER